MANFTGLMGNQKVQRVAAKVISLLKARDPLAGVGVDAVATAMQKFFASFGPRISTLNRQANKQLLEQNEAQTIRMRDAAISELAQSNKIRLREMFENYAQGRINENILRTQAQEVLRTQSLAAAVLGVGGVGNLTENVLLAVQRALTEQFAQLDGFIDDVVGRQITQRDIAALTMFTNNIHSQAMVALRQFSYDTMAADGSSLEERRVLGGSRDCDDCKALANLGWQPGGSLPAIGQGTVCHQYCQCTIQVRPVTGGNRTVGTDADSTEGEDG